VTVFALASKPAAELAGRNHGNVTSPWSGPLQSHIAVVVLGRAPGRENQMPGGSRRGQYRRGGWWVRAGGAAGG
jgi:hypothetical protein